MAKYLVIDHQGDVLNSASPDQTRTAVIRDIHNGNYGERDDLNIAQVIEVCVDEATARDVTEQTILEAEQYGDWRDARGRLPRNLFFKGNVVLLEMFEREAV